MATNARHIGAPALHISRIPGEHGPVVRCSGDLTVATGEALRRELGLLTSLRHPTLILDLSGCRSLDADGVLLLLDAYKHLRAHQGRLVIAAGTAEVARVLQLLGIDAILPVFPTESTAALALRGGGAAAGAPPTWTEARAETLEMWRTILLTLEDEPVDAAMRRIVEKHALCRRAEELLQTRTSREGPRCYLCPLFHTLGGRPQDVGCQSLTQPMLEALLRGDRGGARLQVKRLIHLVETMPLPHD